MALKREVIIFLLSCFLAANAEFDYFWHLQRWPPSACVLNNAICRSSYHGGFVIKSLWPEFDNGSYPFRCNGPPFDINSIPVSLEQILDQHWPSISPMDGKYIWKQAWEEHGVCANYTQALYFKTAVDMQKKYDIKWILEEGGVLPSNHPVEKILVRTALDKYLEKSTGLRCKKTAGATGKVLLESVILCFESDGVTLKNCPSTANKGCPSTFYYFKDLISASGMAVE